MGRGGGWGKAENKAKLSPAGAGSWAELGKKGVWAVSQIMTILEDTCFGPYHFQVDTGLRESLLINSILTNAEAWYGVTKSHIELVESVDELLLRRIPVLKRCCILKWDVFHSST